MDDYEGGCYRKELHIFFERNLSAFADSCNSSAVFSMRILMKCREGCVNYESCRARLANAALNDVD